LSLNACSADERTVLGYRKVNEILGGAPPRTGHVESPHDACECACDLAGTLGDQLGSHECAMVNPTYRITHAFQVTTTTAAGFPLNVAKDCVFSGINGGLHSSWYLLSLLIVLELPDEIQLDSPLHGRF
jgi:hypothetical protein